MGAGPPGPWVLPLQGGRGGEGQGFVFYPLLLFPSPDLPKQQAPSFRK